MEDFHLPCSVRYHANYSLITHSTIIIVMKLWLQLGVPFPNNNEQLLPIYLSFRLCHPFSLLFPSLT